MQFNGKTMTASMLSGMEIAELREADNRNADDIDALESQLERFATVTGTADKPVILRNLQSGTYNVRGYVKMYETQTTAQTGWQHLCHVTQLNGTTYVQLLNPHVNALHRYTIYDTSYSINTLYLNDLLSTQKTGHMYGTLYTHSAVFIRNALYLGNRRIYQVADPLTETDAANKRYVDEAVQNGWLTAVEEGLTT